MNTQRCRQLFSELAERVVIRLEAGESLSPPVGPITDSCIMRSNLVLYGEAATDFGETVEKASAVAIQDPVWSSKSVDRLFGDALASVVNASSPRAEIDSASRRLETELKAAPQEFSKRLSIFGLAADVTSLSFGQVEIVFDSFTPAADFGPHVKVGVGMSCHFAHFKVIAVDAETANLRAESLLEKHLAILNALCSEKYPSPISLSHRFTEFTDLHFIQSVDVLTGLMKTQYGSSRLKAQLTQADLKADLAGRGGDRMSDLLKVRTELGDRILAGLQMAGNACVDPSPQAAFLLFAIALESVILGKEMREELSHQLAVRTAHLVATTLEGRHLVYARTKRLYGIRSKIVHTGSTDVLPSDVDDIRYLCLTSLYALTAHTELVGFTSIKELDIWFLAKLLS